MCVFRESTDESIKQQGYSIRSSACSSLAAAPSSGDVTATFPLLLRYLLLLRLDAAAELLSVKRSADIQVDLHCRNVELPIE